MAIELTLYHAKPLSDELKDRVNQLRTRMNELEQRDLIASYDIMTTTTGTPREDSQTRGGVRRRYTELFDEYQKWARQHNLALGAGFYERESRTPYIEFPELYLVTRAGLDIRGVFPCVERPSENDVHEYTITDYLTAVEKGNDWRTERPPTPRTFELTEHDMIQAHLKNNISEFVDESWKHFETEYSVIDTTSSKKEGRIDLVFRREINGEEYLLVEVKPGRDKIDKAFGQLLRYQYSFVEKHTTPNLETDQIELAIAAPNFYESHRKAADELGIYVIDDISNTTI